MITHMNLPTKHAQRRTDNRRPEVQFYEHNDGTNKIKNKNIKESKITVVKKMKIHAQKGGGL